MLDNEGFSYFVAIVAGDDHENIIKQYDANREVEQYIKMKFDTKELQKLKSFYTELNKKLALESTTKEERDYYTEKAFLYKTMSPLDFYYEINDDEEFDEETGDVLSSKNPKGKFISCGIGLFMSIPFILKNGSTSFSARKGDIDWEKCHLANQNVYALAWDMVMGDRKPQNEEEDLIYTNMKNREWYFMKFGTRENYITTSTAFWGYAFVSEDIEWVEMEPHVNQFEWVSGFYDRFIKPLSDETLLTIYECKKC
jgi:hypothetical protein